MPKQKRERKAPTATGGASWRRATGQKAVGVTLPEDVVNRLRSVAGRYGLSTAELCRRFARWAVAEDMDQAAKKILEKIANST